MQKKLLVLAVGATLAAAPLLSAQADVTVYGAAQFELANEGFDTPLAGNRNDHYIVRTNRWNRGKNDDPTSDKAITFEDNARGRFGIKASEDLGGGMKGFAKIEYDISSTPQDSDFGTSPSIREANAGLDGSWGKLTLGTQKTPYKYIGGVTYDPFVTTNLEARRNGGMTGGFFGQNAFASNAIGYNTPKNIPVDVWVVVSLDDKGATGSGPGSDWDSGDYSAGAKFGSKSWEAFVVSTKNKHNTTGLQADYTANKVGGKFKIGPHTFLGQYEDTSFDNGGGVGIDDSGKLLFLGYHLKFGNNTLVVQVGDGELERTGNPNTQEWTYATVGVIHKFSKTTRVFAGYTQTDLDNEGYVAAADGKRDALSIGMRKDF